MSDLELRVKKLEAENQKFRSALRFYADGEHIHGDIQDNWDSNVHGDDPNWLSNAESESVEMIEDGAIARQSLELEDTSEQQIKDEFAVDKFALLMKETLMHSRLKGRYGWDDKEHTPVTNLTGGLLHHLMKENKGNYIDIANFCMMLVMREDPADALKVDFDTRFVQDIRINTTRELANSFPVMLRKMWSGGEVQGWLLSQHETAR